MGDCADICVNKSSCKCLKGIPGICNIAMYLTLIFIRNYIVFTQYRINSRGGCFTRINKRHI